MAEATALPPGFEEQAAKMPAPLRALIADNAEAHAVSANEVLAALGLPEIRAMPSAGSLRSMALLNLLPRSIGSTTDVKHVTRALPIEACAQLRAAVDAAHPSLATDSVDGCADHQINLTQADLWRLIGGPAAHALWRLADRALTVEQERQEHATLAIAKLAAEQEDSASEGEDSCSDEIEASPEEEEQRPLSAAVEIFVRRYSPTTRPWFPFHQDRATMTVNVALSDDAAHEGGRLLCVYAGKVHRLERSEGSATIHRSTLLHAVSRMTSGVRYSLILFFGQRSNDEQRGENSN